MNLHRLREMHAQGEKITMLTAYDATFARLVDEAGVDCILVGDSLGMIVQGHTSTVPVSLDEMVYHTRCVARGNQTAWVVSDLPFGAYQENREQALRIEQLKQRIAKLQHERFGQSSERRALLEQLELQLFELEEDQAQEETRLEIAGPVGVTVQPFAVIGLLFVADEAVGPNVGDGDLQQIGGGFQQSGGSPRGPATRSRYPASYSSSPVTSA